MIHEKTYLTLKIIIIKEQMNKRHIGHIENKFKHMADVLSSP